MSNRRPVGYVQASTSQQGRSGFGIEAQREALTRFAAAEGFELDRVFVEIETGNRRRHCAEWQHFVSDGHNPEAFPQSRREKHSLWKVAGINKETRAN